MAEFSAAAELDVSVNPQSLQSARRQIENDLGDIEVGIAPSGGGGTDSTTRGQLAGILDANRRQVEALERLAPSGEEGGLGAATAAQIEIQRRTLAAQVASAEADEVTNEILQELLDTVQGRGGLGGGGGGGAGSTLLQVQGARSILGGLGAGGFAGLLGLLSAGRLGGAFSPGIFGQGSAVQPGSDPLGAEAGFLADLFGIEGVNLTPDDVIGQRATITSEDVMAAPAAGAGGRREFQQAVNVDISSTIEVGRSMRESERQRFDQAASQRDVEDIVNTELQRFEQRLRRRFGADTTPRTFGGDPREAKGNPFETSLF